MKKKFYQSIADYYDHIFSSSSNQAEFIVAQMHNHGLDKHLLEIGCGTGNLCWQLSTFFNKVTAIDLDAQMLQKAAEKAPHFKNKIDFYELDMLGIGQKFSKTKFDAIICFGNTMVHLRSLAEIKRFIQQVQQCLTPSGKFFIQIVNYDRILQQNIEVLPMIENDIIRFERNYLYHADRNKIEFKTYLTVKNQDMQIENRVELYPLLKQELEDIFLSLGCRKTKFYGDFKKAEWTKSSMALIAEIDI
ncbi:MAG: class I SAM-dependent methyltransferase [Calditrichaeota bacterium]|nr:MAG: class I SAM-dependent methyltransferase [Calditrichota bacterium]